MAKKEMNYFGRILTWLSEPVGARLSDKLLLISSKLLYLALRLTLRVIIGRKRRDELLRARQLHYRDILRIFYKKPILLRLSDYVFWCRTNADYALDFEIVSDEWEPWFLEIFNPKLGDIVFDIGAYTGKYSILAGKSVGQTGKVVAIEPEPINYQLLCKNVKTNGLEHIIFPINAAAWREVTTLNLFVSGINASIHSIHNVTEKPIQVRTITIDKMVQDLKLDRIDWMKLDVEGADYDVLVGAKETINSEKIRCMLLEIHSPESLRLISELLGSLYSTSIVKRMSEQHCYIVARLAPKYFLDVPVT